MELGIVTSVESNHKVLENARKGQEVCVKIEPIPGESPKMFGRHFDEKDFLVSKVCGVIIGIVFEWGHPVCPGAFRFSPPISLISSLSVRRRPCIRQRPRFRECTQPL